MKDIIITKEVQSREIKIFGCSIVAAILINLIAIIAYKTSFTELYTQWIWTLIISVILYAMSIVVRFIYHKIKRLKPKSE